MKKTSLEKLLPRVLRPSRYLGNEINAVRKDLASVAVKVLLAFPDVYEVGMSHFGLRLLYHILNLREDVAVERVFAPWTDMEELLREGGLPLFSIESRRPAGEFDIVGFSLQYELSYTNVLAMLDLAGIPLRWKDRESEDPLVIAGGPCTVNPEPMAPFFDAMVVGDGEEAVEEIVDAFKQWKQDKGTRRADLHRLLAAIPGVYVPALFSVFYGSDGSIASIDPQPGACRPIIRRVVRDLNSTPHPASFIVPFAQIVHDRINVEIARGCTRGCRFCQAGIIYRPLRERSPAVVESLAEQAQNTTGWEELSLLSLSAGDYSDIKGLLLRLLSRFSSCRTALSLPSLRAETLDDTIVEAIRQGRKTGFTIAPESGTDRLRRVINKNLTEQEILETCHRVFAAGWKSIKLYFMIGLPTETQEDVAGIVELANKVWAQGKGMKQKPQVTVSVSTFIPKPHTPFQWERMINTDEIVKRQEFLRRHLRGRKFHFKWHDAQTSMLEGAVSRGDRRLADVIEEAFRRGCRFDGWSDQFRPQTWDAAFQAHGVEPGAYLKGWELDAGLPWDHIETGVEKSYLIQEWAAARQEQATPDCRSGKCNQCGVCDFTTLCPQIAAREEKGSETEASVLPGVSEPRISKVRLCFSKTGDSRFLSHLETARVFFRAARRAKLPIRYSQGFHPQPKIVFGPALPVGMESLAEYVDMELTDHVTPSAVQERLSRTLPKGLDVFAGEEISLKTPAITDSLYETSYTVSCTGEATLDKLSTTDLAAAVKKLLNSRTVEYVRFRKGKKTTGDMRPVIAGLSLSDDRTLTLTVRTERSGNVRPSEILEVLFGLAEGTGSSLSICKTRMELKAPWELS